MVEASRHLNLSAVTGSNVDLIGSRSSPSNSTFLDADPFGDNVFFGIRSSLLPQDYGPGDVYVARVGGGLPSAAFRGADNVDEGRKRPRARCGKGKTRWHKRCCKKSGERRAREEQRCRARSRSGRR